MEGDLFNTYRYSLNGPTYAIDPSGLIVIYVHGVGSDHKGYDIFRKNFYSHLGPERLGNYFEITPPVDFNWAYKIPGKSGFENPVTNASDSIRKRPKSFKSGIDTLGMSSQQWQAVDKLKNIVKQIKTLFASEVCCKGQVDNINIIAHSQGTLITLAALQEGMKVNEVIFMGSPMDKELVKANKPVHNMDFRKAAKNARFIMNLWSHSDGTAKYLKGGIGAWGLPKSLVSPAKIFAQRGSNIFDLEIPGVDHTGKNGWWAGKWAGHKMFKFRGFHITEGVMLGSMNVAAGYCIRKMSAKGKQELQSIQKGASSYMTKPPIPLKN